MKKKCFFILFAMTFSGLVLGASAKEKFIEKVVKSCGVDRATASSLATKGRSGNVVKLKLCRTNPVKVSETCKVNCSKASGSVVGER